MRRLRKFTFRMEIYGWEELFITLHADVKLGHIGDIEKSYWKLRISPNF